MRRKVKRIAEVFGYPVKMVEWIRKNEGRCPFTKQNCTKQSRLLETPLGICSVQVGQDFIVICPERLLDGEQPYFLKDLTAEVFGEMENVIAFSEVPVKGVGTFDFVVVKHKPLRPDVEDFFVVEIQTDQTTGTGALVRAFEQLMEKGEMPNHVNFGLNTYDTIKRSTTQILNKGILMERWEKKIFWLIQKHAYENFRKRYSFKERYSPDDPIVLQIYDLLGEGERFSLKLEGKVSFSVSTFFKALRGRKGLPSLRRFQELLEGKVRAHIQLTLATRGGE